MSSPFPSLASLALGCALAQLLVTRPSVLALTGRKGCCGHEPASQTPPAAFAEWIIGASEGTRQTGRTKESPEIWADSQELKNLC